ncbi:Cfap74 [Symbiodinium natans]|uniref:Cfap74 protein n=1 Tax=Symbiodinium natans TaxID=878477 RepID=A0A812R6R4_9DINO|nr:Cfap74 [Symbiodinium natans]
MDEEEEEIEEEEDLDEEDEENVDKKLWVPNYSKLELQYMAAARERQRKNICSVQTWQGKEFRGDAFLAKPAVIAFNDFEVGKRYRQVIEVTNVSLTFNQFKLLPLDDSVKDFFEVNFVPPGRMSAGVTRYITLWFVPKVSQDIVSTFPILAKTGRIDFPLRCTTKKTILTITPQDAEANPSVDFGSVLVGESAERELIIKNTGALAADFSVLRSDEGVDQLTDMTTWTEKGVCKALGSSKIAFKFVPTTLGEFSTDLRLCIANGAPGDANYEKEFCVRVRGSCLDVPIYVDSEEYDMHTCVYGHIFRESVMIRNRASVAMKIQVQKPKQIEGELQLNTALAYIQGHGSQVIQVKLAPKADFLDRHPEYRDAKRPDVPGAFRIPMRIVGADQVLPVNTCLIGTFTTDAMTFLPGELNFGPCLVGTSAVQRLTIVNESALKRRYAFTRLPSYLSVQEVPQDVLEEESWGGLDAKPGTIAVVDAGIDGSMGSLLPGEKRQVSFLYTPESAIEMDNKILCKVITGDLCVRDFVISCTGQGMSPSLEFSETKLDLAAIPADASTKDSIVVTNVSKVAQMLNVVLPPMELSGVKVTPICFSLQPKESQRLQVEFKPTKEYVDLLKMPAEEKPAEPEDGAAAPPDGEAAPADEENPGAMDAEEYSRHQIEDIREHGGRRWEAEGTVHGSWRLPICFKPASQGFRDGRDQFCYLGINTCVLPSVLAMQPAVLDFGDVTAGQRALRPLVITNLAVEDGVQELHMEALPENQGFTILNAPRAVGSKPFQFMVEFKPQLVQIYQTALQLRTQNTRVQVPLRGKGVSPVLKIEPQDRTRV